MLLSIIRYIRGYVRLRITGHSTERFLNASSHKGIYLWGLRAVDGTYELCVSVKGFGALKPIIKKTGTKVTIVEKSGLPFFLHKYRRRRLFFGGAVLCIALIYLLSLRIWNIEFTGNLSRTDETLLDFLETTEVDYGMKKSQLDCSKIAKDIRKEYNDIIWVSASIRGTRLLIQVKENQTALQSASEETEEPADIIADCDCVITQIITRKGVPLVKEGDAVKKGDILVSASVEVKDDAGEVINYQYQASDADIKGQTSLHYEEELARTYTVKEDSGIQKEECFIKIGPYRFGLGSRSHKYSHFEVISQEKSLKIGKDFYLPISTGTRTIHPYTPKACGYTQKELQKLLSDRFAKDCEDLEKKGVEIIKNDVKIYTEPKIAAAKGTLTVLMPIGEKIPAQKKQIPQTDTPTDVQQQ